MHHQGIFRIPGAQADINAYKLQFERGLFSLPFVVVIVVVVVVCAFSTVLWHCWLGIRKSIRPVKI